MKVEFWFDFSCPYAYLASREIEGICRRADVDLTLCPMLLGGVFRATGAGDGPMATLTPPRADNNLRDMHRWAERRGTVLRVPPAHPMRTVRALRTLLGLPEARWPAAMHALYAAYWQDAGRPGADGADVTDPAVIAAALAVAGIPTGDIAAAAAGADDDRIKDDLRRRTDQAVAHGIFGAPAFVIERERGGEPILIWGQDRLHWVEAILAGWDPDAGTAPSPRPVSDPAALAAAAASPPALDFWFDYASPWSYLGSTRIEAIAAAAGGATVRWRPMLLGALFREVGAPDVPLFAMPEAKRRYVAGELGRWAHWLDVPFRFTSRFPLRTVTALRLTLLAPAPALVHAIYRAAWVDNLDIADEAVLRALCTEAGVDPARVADTSLPATKQALVAETTAARAAGVFGAPTTIVHDPGGPLRFWGQDRLDLVAAALRGWRPEAG